MSHMVIFASLRAMEGKYWLKSSNSVVINNRHNNKQVFSMQRTLSVAFKVEVKESWASYKMFFVLSFKS